MEIKKSPKANLEKRRAIWLFIGYVVVLIFVFSAFKWAQWDKKKNSDQAVAGAVFEETITPVSEAPKQQLLFFRETTTKVPEVPEIVDDATEVQETVDADMKEIEQKVEVKYRVPAPVVEVESEEHAVFEFVENTPEFPGGEAALIQYLAKKIRYPSIAQENGIQGRVIVQFVVNKDGSIVEATVVRNVDPNLDKEALRVINSMPRWKPGMQRGKPVRVKYAVPVTFRLQ